MIRDFEAKFDAAYDLRLYQQAKGYTDASPDVCEYWIWGPRDTVDVADENTLDIHPEGEMEEF